MSLGPENVKRTWQVRQGGMEYRMDVRLGGEDQVSAAMHIPGRDMDRRTLPPESVEYNLQDLIVSHMRKALFPRS